MYVVMYKTATMVSKVDNSLAGTFMYFADPKDALDTGLFCEKVVVWKRTEQDEPIIDGYGKSYKEATEEEIDIEIRKLMNK